jgi:hypothetical protein
VNLSPLALSCSRILLVQARGVHSLLYFAYTCVRDLFIKGVIYLAKNIIRWWYFTCEKPENIICDGILHVNMFHYFKIPYFTCTFFTNFTYNEYIGPYFLLHVVLRFLQVNSRRVQGGINYESPTNLVYSHNLWDFNLIDHHDLVRKMGLWESFPLRCNWQARRWCFGPHSCKHDICSQIQSQEAHSPILQ